MGILRTILEIGETEAGIDLDTVPDETEVAMAEPEEELQAKRVPGSLRNHGYVKKYQSYPEGLDPTEIAGMAGDEIRSIISDAEFSMTEIESRKRVGASKDPQHIFSSLMASFATEVLKLNSF